jgi:peptidoglycan/LPS O-acetylase OafA/YrhL
VLLYHFQTLRGLADGSRAILRPFGEVATVGSVHQGLLARGIEQGKYGVELFFVVSGFVLALPYVAWQAGGSPVSVGRYLLRRLTRIEPPYLVAMTLIFVAGLVAGAGVGWSNFLASIAYLHGVVFGRASPLNGPAWSLEVEVQFYLVVPLLAIAFATGDTGARRRRIAMVALVAIVFQLSGLGNGPRFQAFLGNFLQFFLAGWLLADVYVVSWSSSPRPDRRWDVVSVIGWPVLVVGLLLSPEKFAVILAPALMLGLFCAAFRGPVTASLLRNRWLTTIGGMAYSIYLFHYPLIVLLDRRTRPLLNGPPVSAMLARVVIVLPVVVLAGTLFFVLVEKPCMNPAWPKTLVVWVRRSFASRSR